MILVRVRKIGYKLKHYMKKLKLFLHILIIPIFLLELYSRWHQNITLEYIAKPWLMIWIIIYFLIYSERVKSRAAILLAFIFSWVGDMALMMANTNEELFYAGVGGFFISQLFYIYSFYKVSGDKSKEGYLKARPLLILPFVLFLAGILLILIPDMEGIMLPIIIVYALSLIGMSLAALNRKGRVSLVSYQLVFYGSLLFVLSDSMIAVSKFTYSFPRAQFLIMLCYFSAQYLIMSGLLKEWKR